jgi:hypothetical protein
MFAKTHFVSPCRFPKNPIHQYNAVSNICTTHGTARVDDSFPQVCYVQAEKVAEGIAAPWPTRPEAVKVTLEVTEQDGSKVAYEFHDVDTTGAGKHGGYLTVGMTHDVDMEPIGWGRQYARSAVDTVELHIKGPLRMTGESNQGTWLTRLTDPPPDPEWVKAFMPECRCPDDATAKQARKCQTRRQAEGERLARIATNLAKAKA